MEYWDLYNKDLQLMNIGHASTDPIPEGLYHLSIEVWSFDGQRFFLSQRAFTKKYYPGYWECTGGSALSGEDFKAAACREIKEELGVMASSVNLTSLAVEVHDQHIVAVFMFHLPLDAGINLASREIICGRWFNFEELESLHRDAAFVPYQFHRYLKYVRLNAFNQCLCNKPSSIRRLTSHRDELNTPLRGLPHYGVRPDGASFSPALNRINEAFLVYGDALYTQKTLLPESVNNSLGSGSPLNTFPFPPIVKAVKEVLNTTKLSQYPLANGDLEARKSICAYLQQEGFSELISSENIIFAASTTHAYHMILKLICRPGDVVLFTAPTYGLFAFDPERVGAETRFIELSANDDWFVNPDKLEQRIQSLNHSLQQAHQQHNSTLPRVVAFFNENPHNPMGKVMSKHQEELLKRIAQVCRKNGVFLIDDLLYRDLGYDRDNLALPVASFNDEYQNTITLLGISKSYGMAGIRAGIIIADEIIVRGMRNIIFQEIDSASHLNSVALAAAFNTTSARMEAYHTYFEQSIDTYRFHLNLIRAVVDGIESTDTKYRQLVETFVYTYLESREKAQWWLSGIKEVNFIEKLMPESGFFCLLDFTPLRGRSCDGITITDDISLLLYLFHNYRINFITGKAINWPNKEQIVARISYSAAPEKIVTVFTYIKEEIEKLK